MKPLLVLILAAAIGYVSYEYAYPPIAELMKFTKHVPKAEPKNEVAVVEAPKPKVEEPKFKMPADFAFLGLGKKAETWDLMLATDKRPFTALFTEPGKVYVKSGEDVITASGGRGLTVAQSLMLSAGVKISGVGFHAAETDEAAESVISACQAFDITREGAKSTLFVETAELEATMKKEPFTFAGEGVTYMEFDDDSKMTKREIKGAATLTDILGSEAHPPADAPKGWMWSPETFVCYRAGKRIGAWDVMKAEFREATDADGPESFDFAGLLQSTIKAIADTMPKEAPKMAVAPEPPQDPTGFVPPVFPPVEQVTQNWTLIPAGFFSQPKQVTMKKDLELTMKAGGASAKTNVKAGGKVTVTGQSGPNLIVGNPGSPMRGEVPMEDTDIKEVFTAAYEQIKIVRTEQARKAHEYQLAAAERAKNMPAGGGKGGAAAGVGGKPEKDADGKYPILLSSMRAGEVTEIKPDNVKSWGDPQQEKIDDKDYWTINVKYETQTMFGKFETEAQARIRNGKVEKWVYTGSGEVVP